MATDAFIGAGTLLDIMVGSPATPLEVGEVVSIGPLARKNDRVEVTHLQSTSKEFIYGLSEGQNIEIVCNYIPTNTGQSALLAAQASRAVLNLKYTLPDEGGNKYFRFDAAILESSIGPTTPNTATQIKFGANVTGDITGPI